MYLKGCAGDLDGHTSAVWVGADDRILPILAQCTEKSTIGSRRLTSLICAEDTLWLQWLRRTLVKARAGLTCEEDTDSCSDKTSQSCLNLNPENDSASRASSQSSFSLEDLCDGNASDGSFEEGLQARSFFSARNLRLLEEFEAIESVNSERDADSQASSEAYQSSANESDSDSGSSGNLEENTECDANTVTDSKASVESQWWGPSHSERKFLFDFCSLEGFGSDFCDVYLNRDWEHIPCIYREHTGKDLWDDVTAFLNTAEPGFKAHTDYYIDSEPEVHVKTTKNSYVKRLKQLLVEVEQRYQCYSVPKLTRLIRTRLNQPRFGIRAVIEYQDKFGKDAILHMLETHEDIMFRYSYG